MVTFSDCMTLLLTFFVLLLSFSSFDVAVFQKLKVIFADALPAATEHKERDSDAVLPAEQIQPTEDISEGSEKPTSEKGKQDHLKQETRPVDFRTRKVFLISSDQIFWGKGATISLQGRQTLATVASFLRKVPSRIVISEGPRLTGTQDGPTNKISEEFGLPRAWAVVEYLTARGGLDKDRFSISATSILPQPSYGSGEPDATTERVLEIFLLERSIYN